MAQDGVEFSRIDGILDELQPYLVMGVQNHNLRNFTFERWRWDEPRLTVTWAGDDHITRNLGVSLRFDGGNERMGEILVEVNAWRDTDEMGGSVRIRKWRTARIGELKIREIRPRTPVLIFDEQLLIHSLYIGFRTVSSWQFRDLETATPIPAFASGRLLG